MRNFLIISAALGVIAGTFYFFSREAQTDSPQEAASEEVRSVPTFSWSYQESETEGIPYTDIRLTASYENGTSETKIIDRVEGNCNEYENADSDIYERSTMIICYYAGLGRYFKVIADEEGYVVQRKIFEEASPDYNPPQQPYETIARYD